MYHQNHFYCNARKNRKTTFFSLQFLPPSEQLFFGFCINLHITEMAVKNNKQMKNYFCFVSSVMWRIKLSLFYWDFGLVQASCFTLSITWKIPKKLRIGSFLAILHVFLKGILQTIGHREGKNREFGRGFSKEFPNFPFYKTFRVPLKCTKRNIPGNSGSGWTRTNQE